MSELSISTATLQLAPAEAVVNQEIQVDGLGFLVNSFVEVSVHLPGGAGFHTSILTDAAGNFSSTVGATPASGQLLATGEPLTVGDTVTIDDQVYTFVAAPDETANEVLLGVYGYDSLQNLVAAINLDSGAGSTYGSETEAHPTVRAIDVTADSLQLVARTAGTGGNALALSTTAAELTASAATLLGGQEESGENLLTFTSNHDGTVLVRATDGTNEVEQSLRVWRNA